MILESIVTTRNQLEGDAATNGGVVNVSPMGPRILNQHADGEIASFELRPFDTSRTFANLKAIGQGVMHVHDDVELFAMAAIGKLHQVPDSYEAPNVSGDILTDSCRAYEFEVKYIDETGPRMSLNCDVVAVHRHRDFFGFNRAKHAVLEAAILATRINFLPSEEIESQFEHLAIIVDKTAGPSEQRAFETLSQFVTRSMEKTR